MLDAIGDERSALAGGVAVGAHGYVRATKDVDIVVGIALSEAQHRLAVRGIECAVRRGDPLEGDFSCIRGTLDGVPFDVIPQLVQVAWERTISVAVEEQALRVVDLGSLLALKLRAGGPRDLLDVAMLVLLHPEHEAAARELARSRRLEERLDAYLLDPRLLAEVADIRSR